jgi:hypothetical protein
MGNKKNAKRKSTDDSKKVQPISHQFGEFEGAINLYHRHPSLPTFLNVLDRALLAGIRFKNVESELIHLINIDDDQYFGAYGSKYFNQNFSDLEQISRYRESAAEVLAVCKSLWSFLQKIKTEEVWNFENFLVGTADYLHIYENEQADELDEPAIDPEVISETKALRLPQGLADKIADAVVAQRDSREELGKLMRLHGNQFVPWAAWIVEYLPSRSLLAEGIDDLNQYLGSYYVVGDDSTVLESTEWDDLTNVDSENAAAITRISTFLIFNRLFKRIVYCNSSFELSTFYEERIEHLSSRESIGNAGDEANYIIAISNVLMIAAKLGVSAAKEGVASAGEVKRDFLLDVDSEYLDLACLAPLAGSGFAQMISAINPYEGDRPEAYRISKALRVADYGCPAPWDPDLFDDMFGAAYGGLNPSVEKFLRPQIELAAKKWLVPLQNTIEAARIFDDFWSDNTILNKISDALFEADKESVTDCKFLAKDLSEISLHTEHFDDDYHPAIFSRKFCNVMDFVDFDDAEWLKFSRSLYRAGQVRHACTVVALYITIAGVNRLFNVDKQNLINIPSLARLLNQLSGHQSFLMIRQAICDLFETYDKLPTLYLGSLKDFSSIPKGDVISIKARAKESLETHKKKLIDSGYLVTKLSSSARDSLLKGYTLARTKDLVIFNLADDAVRNYILAIEGELRSRIPDIDRNLAEELKYLNIDIDWKGKSEYERRGVFRGLSSICSMIEQYSRLSDGAKEKLAAFRELASHHDVSQFRLSMREFITIRNAVQHADGQHGNAGTYLDRVEELMFGRGQLVRILCETRK